MHTATNKLLPYIHPISRPKHLTTLKPNRALIVHSFVASRRPLYINSGRGSRPKGGQWPASESDPTRTICYVEGPPSAWWHAYLCDVGDRSSTAQLALLQDRPNRTSVWLEALFAAAGRVKTLGTPLKQGQPPRMQLVLVEPQLQTPQAS